MAYFQVASEGVEATRGTSCLGWDTWEGRPKGWGLRVRGKGVES